MQPPGLHSSSPTLHNDTTSIFQMSTSLMAFQTSTSSSLAFSIATIAVSSIPLPFSTSLPSNLAPNMSTNTTLSNGDDDSGECRLLGPFALLIQGALGALALLALVYKRWRERPQRPVKIWAFDASKQVFGSVLLHIVNLLMSMISPNGPQVSVANTATSPVSGTSLQDYRPNPCSLYLLNLAIDTTAGIPVLIAILKVLTVAASYTPLARPPESIKSGNYGNPPRATWWLKQSMIYFGGLLGMKICVLILFQLCPWIVKVGDWALKWTEGNEALQIAFVMLIFPLIMNATQYYIIDTFIKNREVKDGEQSDTHDADHEEQDGLLAEEGAENRQSLEDEADKFGVVTASRPSDDSRGESSNEDSGTSSRSGESNNLISQAREEGIDGRPRI